MTACLYCPLFSVILNVVSTDSCDVHAMIKDQDKRFIFILQKKYDIWQVTLISPQENMHYLGKGIWTWN